MKQQSLSISIPEPCHEKWSDMSPTEKGRHCSSCQKTVVDFTRMPKVKIAEFVSENQGNLCGRFSSDQLNVELLPPKPSKTWLKYAAILFGLLPTIGFGQEVTKLVVPENQIHQPNIRGKIKLDSHIQKHNIAENMEVSGIVLDKHNGKPLAFAQIAIFKNGKLLNTIETNFEGEFKTEIPKNAYLMVSYIGYMKQKISYQKITSDKNLRIGLREHFALMGVVMIENPNAKVKEDIHDKVEKQETDIPNQELMRDEQTMGDIEVLSPPPSFNNEDFLVGEILFEEENLVFEEPIEEAPAEMITLPTVEILATEPIHAIPVTGGIQIVNHAGNSLPNNKESWLKKLWKKFKSWISESHKEAQKDKENTLFPIAEIVEFPDTTADPPVKIESNKKEIIAINGTNNNVPSKTPIRVKVFPNPSTGIFNLEIPITLDKFFIEVNNMNNQVILRQDHSNFNGSVDLGDFAAGSYIISIISGRELINSQVVIKI